MPAAQAGGALRALLVVAAALLVAAPAATRAALQTRTRASLWYRGMPAGEPRQADLDAISAAGFTSVTWPTLFVKRALDLRRMAERAGLEVVIRTEPTPITPESAMGGDAYVDIDVARTPSRLFPALLWRSVAHGSRIISFDAGLKEGSGLLDPAGKPAPWGGAASAVAHQLGVNAVMVDTFMPGPAIKMDPAVPELDVVLIDAVRSWVIIATNTAAPGTRPADTHVFLPRGVPPAEWLNLFDGSTISMVRQTTGPRWHLVLGPGDVRVYAIGKIEG